jgi:hypothetical protein
MPKKLTGLSNEEFDKASSEIPPIVPTMRFMRVGVCGSSNVGRSISWELPDPFLITERQ